MWNCLCYCKLILFTSSYTEALFLSSLTFVLIVPFVKLSWLFGFTSNKKKTLRNIVIYFRRGSEGSKGFSNKIKFRVDFKDTKCDISYGSKVGTFVLFSSFKTA